MAIKQMLLCYEALYEAVKVLEKFAWKVCCSAVGVWVFTRRQMEQTVNRKCMFYFVIFILLFCVIWELTAFIFVYVCFVDYCIAALLQTVK